MTQPLPPSELILNPDGSIYHLNLRPEQIATTIILVGDQNRVAKVSKYFDKIDEQVQKREFVTHTGWLGNKHLTVLSTGIGTDNIDIVINELDALVNIDLKTRLIKDQKTSLEFIRIGTSGALSAHIPIDSHLISTYGIGLDGLMSYYHFEPSDEEHRLAETFNVFSQKHRLPLKSNAAKSDTQLIEKLGKGMIKGITLSCPGFYGPQGRMLRLKSRVGASFFEEAGDFYFDDLSLTNFEMETSAILGMSKMLGHRATSTNAIIANRVTSDFSTDPGKTVDSLIQVVLGKL